MSKSEKILETWIKKTPTEARVNDVKIVLNDYFENQWEWDGGSHITVKNGILKKHPQFPTGDLSVPVKKGRFVKSYYLKDLIKAIRFIQDYERWLDEKRS